MEKLSNHKNVCQAINNTRLFAFRLQGHPKVIEMLVLDAGLFMEQCWQHCVWL